MRVVFADAGYWIALLNPRDSLHSKAIAISKTLKECRIVTSEMVLAEFMDGLGKEGNKLRAAAAQTVEALQANANVSVIPQTSMQFRAALERYRYREDKMCGLTDCASFLIMEEHRIQEALAHDHDFEQAGFKALLKD